MLRHLRYFSTVAEEGHVGRAAARLVMAQPPLSQAILRLEKALGVSLFHRGPRGMRLSDAGRALLPRARALLEDEQALRRTAAGLADSERAVRVGVVPAVGARLATELTVAAGASRGDRAELVVAPTRDLVDAVAAGALDVALVAHPVVADGLTGGPVAALPCTLLIPAGHPAAAQARAVRLAELRDLAPAVTPRSHEPAAHDVLADDLDLRGSIRRPLEVDSPSAALAAVATGRAYYPSVDPDLGASGIIRCRPAGRPLLLRFRLVWRAPGPIPPVLDAVQRRLDEATAGV